ncbi:hypothetical protein WDU94_006146, partial [Cyamophila willieti]
QITCIPTFKSLALTVLEKSCAQARKTPKTPIFRAWRSDRLTDLDDRVTVAYGSRIEHACKISSSYD